MKLTHYSTPLFILCSVLLSSCSRNEGDDGYPMATFTYYDIPNEDWNKMPYSGQDTLIYINNMGDTAKLIGKGRTIFTDTKPLGYNTTEVYQRVKYSFDFNPLLNLICTVGVYDHIAPIMSEVDITINGIQFQSVNIRGAGFIDTLTWKAEKHIGVKLKGINLQDTSSFIFYTNTNGILEMHLPNNKTWLKQ